MTYLYDCELCDKIEVSQKISENPLKTCPKCGGPCKRVPFTGKDAGVGFTINGYNENNGYS